ncbi:hypothetical protein FB451DRAFT_1277862 [Mycena latifolia]|nr:hypothetical protein FB451DRAFT_1277862 [Mycena latifolia]
MLTSLLISNGAWINMRSAKKFESKPGFGYLPDNLAHLRQTELRNELLSDGETLDAGQVARLEGWAYVFLELRAPPIRFRVGLATLGDQEDVSPVFGVVGNGGHRPVHPCECIGPYLSFFLGGRLLSVGWFDAAQGGKGHVYILLSLLDLLTLFYWRVRQAVKSTLPKKWSFLRGCGASSSSSDEMSITSRHFRLTGVRGT